MNNACPAQYIRYFFTLLLVWLGWIPLSFALLFTDISTYNFPKIGERGLRILKFDVGAQHMHTIIYIKFPTSRNGEQKAYEDASLSVTFQGKVTLKSAFDPQRMACYTYGQIIGHKGNLTSFQKPAHPFEKLKIILKKKPAPYQKFAIESRSLSQDKNVQSQVLTFSNLTANQQENRNERGFIGERLTQLLFLWLGFESLAAQNGSGQGLDGVFMLEKEKVTVLTESKCRNESKSASKYMSEELNEARILERITKMTQSIKRQNLLRRIRENMGKTYKVVQRIMNNGAVQSLLHPINTATYAENCMHYELLEKQEIAVLFQSRLKSLAHDILGSPLTQQEKRNLAQIFQDLLLPSSKMHADDSVKPNAVKVQVDAQDRQPKHILFNQRWRNGRTHVPGHLSRTISL